MRSAARWPVVAPLTAAIGVAAVLAAFWGTFAAMATQWVVSPTYSHGLIVVPVVLWLAWRTRAAWITECPQLSFAALVALSTAAICWALSRIARLDVLEQLAAVAVLALVPVAVLGPRVARHVAFPLGLLLFMVPLGEELVPSLMRFTADFAVLGIRVLGIPVFRDGMLISLPGGDFEVVKACSGIRYLLTATFVGTLFAYLTFESPWRRAGFVAACFVGSIAANGLRALIVILVAHYSNYRIGIGVDHIVFGWVWFGAVMLALMWLGGRFSDRSANTVRLVATNVGARVPPAAMAMALAAMGVMSVVVILAAFVGWAEARPASAAIAPLGMPVGERGWVRRAASRDWRVSFAGTYEQREAAFETSDGVVDLRLIRYLVQSRRTELAESTNEVFDPAAWSVVSSSRLVVDVGGGVRHEVARAEIRRGERRRIVWHWYSQAGRSTASRSAFKVRSGLRALTGRREPATVTALSTEVLLTDTRSDELLRRFVVMHFPTLVRCVSDNVATRNGCVAGDGPLGGAP